MSSPASQTQKIGRLTPFKDVLARLADEVSLVAGRAAAPADAVGRALAADVVAKTDYPAKAIALRDGYAVRADDTADASSYAPAPLANVKAVQVGDAMPARADAVTPPEGVMDAGGIAAVASVAGGDGVLAAGADAQAGKPLRSAGHRLRQIDVAVLQALDVKSVSLHVPRVRVVAARAADAFLETIVGFTERFVVASGGEIVANSSRDLRAALSEDGADFIIIVGGSGMGERDASITTLQSVGHLHFHGIGIAPGETSALGFISGLPVLIVPGRIDAAFAALATIGDAVVARLSGSNGESPVVSATLARKVVSTIGLVEIVPVELQDAQATPLASGYLPMQAMLRADGYIVVPAQSEGYPAGSVVAVRAMP